MLGLPSQSLRQSTSAKNARISLQQFQVTIDIDKFLANFLLGIARKYNNIDRGLKDDFIATLGSRGQKTRLLCLLSLLYLDQLSVTCFLSLLFFQRKLGNFNLSGLLSDEMSDLSMST